MLKRAVYSSVLLGQGRTTHVQSDTSYDLRSATCMRHGQVVELVWLNRSGQTTPQGLQNITNERCSRVMVKLCIVAGLQQHVDHALLQGVERGAGKRSEIKIATLRLWRASFVCMRQPL